MAWLMAKRLAPESLFHPPDVIKQGIPVLLPHLHEFFLSAGEKVKYLKTCVMPTLSQYSRIKVIVVSVTTILGFPSVVGKLFT